MKSVRRMLGLLGLDPLDQMWQRQASGDRSALRGVVDVLVRGLLDQREEARPVKDFAAADAIRDQLKAAGVEIEDTPGGPRWAMGSTGR